MGPLAEIFLTSMSWSVGLLDLSPLYIAWIAPAERDAMPTSWTFAARPSPPACLTGGNPPAETAVGRSARRRRAARPTRARARSPRVCVRRGQMSLEEQLEQAGSVAATKPEQAVAGYQGIINDSDSTEDALEVLSYLYFHLSIREQARLGIS